ncbi:anthranilate synthase component I, partial [Vibrio parahaemolyticus]|nr:anthranilate synthase component I [Vibrio parahaemolyticus]
PLGNAEATNQCPDYVFYVAETLLVVDHQTESCQLQATLFVDGSEKAALETRIAEISAQCAAPKLLPSAKQIADVTVEPSVSDADFCQTVRDLK